MEGDVSFILFFIIFRKKKQSKKWKVMRQIAYYLRQEFNLKMHSDSNI